MSWQPPDPKLEMAINYIKMRREQADYNRDSVEAKHLLVLEQILLGRKVLKPVTSWELADPADSGPTPRDFEITQGPLRGQ